MKYFLDTEFLEDGNTIDLISIGVVCEDGRSYYAVSEEAPWDRIVNNDWLRTNVVPHVPVIAHGPVSGVYRPETTINPYWKYRREIAADLNSFVTGEDNEFWAYYGDYDWVATCRLFGRMIDLPGHFPKLCYDLRQWLNHKNLKHVRQPDDAPHNALSDARWVAETYKQYSSMPGYRS